jgi:hypothetical protein
MQQKELIRRLSTTHESSHERVDQARAFGGWRRSTAGFSVVTAIDAARHWVGHGQHWVLSRRVLQQLMLPLACTWYIRETMRCFVSRLLMGVAHRS